MSIMTIIGIVIGGATIAIDRLLRKLPNWLAISLYIIAAILIIAGMIISRKST